jgi:hypothetical protein
LASTRLCDPRGAKGECCEGDSAADPAGEQEHVEAKSWLEEPVGAYESQTDQKGDTKAECAK